MSLSRVDAAIVVAGLIAAPASGVAAYRLVGPYGDGPLNVGLYRAQDAATGRQLVYRDVSGANGARLRYFFDDVTRTLVEIRLMRAGEADVILRHEDESNGQVDAGVKVAFSLRGKGIIDAWEYRDAHGRLQKIEVSRRQNGKVDRWEFYTSDQLTRVEEDEDGDGRVDRWVTYEAGILIEETRDRDGDGRPDPRR